MTTNRRNSFESSFWGRVFGPQASLTDLGEIRQAQLGMALALLMAVGNLITGLSIGMKTGASLSVLTLLVFAALGFLAYFLGRSRWYRTGASILTWSLACQGYGFLWMGTGSPTASLTSTLPIALILGGILFRVPELVLLTIAAIGVTLLVPSLTPALSMLEAARLAGNFFSIATLLTLMTFFRESLNRTRLKDLHLSNQELQVIRDSLEQLVAERTLAAEFARMEAEAARKSLDAQLWQNQGLMRLGEALNDNQPTAGLASAALRAVCQHLDAPVGGLFLLREGQLEMAGGYAYPLEPSAALRLRLGEGLLGQAALEKRPTFFANPPEGYFTIASGLSRISPRQLVCWPFCAGDQVLGVLELGLMTELNEAGQQFLANAALSLARKFQAGMVKEQTA